MHVISWEQLENNPHRLSATTLLTEIYFSILNKYFSHNILWLIVSTIARSGAAFFSF